MQKQWGPVLAGLAPLALYYGVDALLGRDLALAVTVAWLIGEVLYYRYRGWPLTPFYLFAAAVVLASVGVDVLVDHATGPAWASALNLALFGVCAAAAAALLPQLLCDLEQSAGRALPLTNASRKYFRTLLAACAGIFFLFSLAAAFVATQPSAPDRLVLLTDYGAYVLLAIGTIVLLYKSRRRP